MSFGNFGNQVGSWGIANQATQSIEPTQPQAQNQGNSTQSTSKDDWSGQDQEGWGGVVKGNNSGWDGQQNTQGWPT